MWHATPSESTIPGSHGADPVRQARSPAYTSEDGHRHRRVALDVAKEEGGAAEGSEQEEGREKSPRARGDLPRDPPDREHGGEHAHHGERRDRRGGDRDPRRPKPARHRHPERLRERL